MISEKQLQESIKFNHQLQKKLISNLYTLHLIDKNLKEGKPLYIKFPNEKQFKQKISKIVSLLDSALMDLQE
jgi:hypothetical protein